MLHRSACPFTQQRNETSYGHSKPWKEMKIHVPLDGINLGRVQAVIKRTPELNQPRPPLALENVGPLARLALVGLQVEQVVKKGVMLTHILAPCLGHCRKNTWILCSRCVAPALNLTSTSSYSRRFEDKDQTCGFSPGLTLRSKRTKGVSSDLQRIFMNESSK